MKRKVIKQGNNTLTITLPRKWAVKYGIKPGDEIFLEQQDNKLMVSSESREVARIITIDSSELERFTIAKLISACYELGLDKVTIKLGKEKVRDWFAGEADFVKTVNFFVDRLIGFEVTSQTKTKIDIENLSKTMLKLDSVVGKLFSMMIEELEHFVEAIEKRDKNLLADGEIRHDNITKFASLGLRITYEDKNLSEAESLNHFVILSLLDKAADFVRYAYKNMKIENKANNDIASVVRLCLKYVELYRSCYYNCELNKTNELDDIRGEVKKRFKLLKRPADIEIGSYFNSFVEVLNGAVKPRIMIEIDKKAV